MVIDFIPIDSYTPFYYQVILVVTLLTFFHTQLLPIQSKQTLNYIKGVGILTFLFVLVYMGMRPISGRFIDMLNYARSFQDFQFGERLKTDRDVIFQSFTLILSKIVSINTYFLICAAIYILPLYSVSKKWFGSYWFYGFLALVGSFSFWTYGVNGIRNGMATSLFLLGLSKDKLSSKIIIFYLSIGIHKSMLLPFAGYILSIYLKKPKLLLLFWIISIPLSLAAGGLFESIFATLGFDDRLSYLSEEGMESKADKFKSTGFRWDFLIYSAAPIVMGWYYIVKLKYKDKIYYGLFVTYVFANAFWILVIRASFSNRFAYLSWFLMALVIMYPLLKHQILSQGRQHRFIGWTLLAYYSFTYFMFNIYYSV